jgi:cytoskeleton protein RodZ
MTYAIGYVRTYAQHLDLDVDLAISLFKTEASDLNGPRQLVFPSPAPEGKVPGGALMFVAAFLAVFAYAGWYYVTDSGRAIAGYTLAVPEALQAWLDEKPRGGTSSDGFTSTAVASSPAGLAEDTVDAPTQNQAQDQIQSQAQDTSADIAVSPPLITASAIAGDLGPSAPVVATEHAAPTQAAPRPTLEATPMVGSSATVASGPSIVPSPGLVRPIGQASTPTVPVQLAAVAGGINADSDIVRPVSAQTDDAEREIITSNPVGAADTAIPQAPSMNPMETPSASVTQSRGLIQPASASAGQVDGTRVIIRASAASWVQVRAADSTTVMTRVMRAGDTYAVPERDGLRLFTGNAGALTILVDGKAVPKLGGTGQIARNIDLEPATLRQQVN